jgi:hypothetical protein
MHAPVFSDIPAECRPRQDRSLAIDRLRSAAAALLIGFLLVGCQQATSGPKAEQTAAARQREEKPESEHFTVLPDEINWLSPPPAAAFLPEGVEIAFIEGAVPTLPLPFTFRLKFPPGSRLMPHTHPTIEKLTVISGTLHQGIGEVFDQAATETVPAGGFSYRAPGIPHFVWFDEETVLQFHGSGPFGLTYVNPADDPRNQS